MTFIMYNGDKIVNLQGIETCIQKYLLFNGVMINLNLLKFFLNFVKL